MKNGEYGDYIEDIITSAMRDKIIHAYFGVNLKVIWKTVKEDIPQLKPLVQNMLKDLGE